MEPGGGVKRRTRRSSEQIAAKLLEEMGFNVIEFRRPVIIGGVEVSDIDIVAEKDGELYAVEVKAGVADVSAVRQAYVNSRITGMKPLVVARGVDEKAQALASRLGVEIIRTPDELLVSSDELRMIVEDAVYSALVELAATLAWCGKLGSEEVRILEALAASEDLAEAAERLGVDVRELASTVSKLRERGVLPPLHGYKPLKVASLLLSLCGRIMPKADVPRP